MPQVGETILLLQKKAGQHLTFSKCNRDMEQKEAGVGKCGDDGGGRRVQGRPAINKSYPSSQCVVSKVVVDTTTGTGTIILTLLSAHLPRKNRKFQSQNSKQRTVPAKGRDKPELWIRISLEGILEVFLFHRNWSVIISSMISQLAPSYSELPAYLCVDDVSLVKSKFQIPSCCASPPIPNCFFARTASHLNTQSKPAITWGEASTPGHCSKRYRRRQNSKKSVDSEVPRSLQTVPVPVPYGVIPVLKMRSSARIISIVRTRRRSEILNLLVYTYGR